MKELERPAKSVSKVAVIGTGMVGSTFAYAMMIRGIASEIVLVDANSQRANGEAMDLSHGVSFVQPVSITAGSYEDCINAQVVVITAGAAQKPGESRLALVTKNLKIYESIIPQLQRVCPQAILLIVTNPVDIMTYAAMKMSSFPKERVIGSGTVLDSSRLRYSLSEHCAVDPKNVHAYILGEHGDSEIPAWSLVNIAGTRLGEMCFLCGRECSSVTKQRLFEQVRDAAYQIIEAKGATYYAIGLALVEIVEAILRDEHSVMPVSVYAKGHLGLPDVCISIPVVVDGSGVSRLLNIQLPTDEMEGLMRSAYILRSVIDEVGL